MSKAPRLRARELTVLRDGQADVPPALQQDDVTAALSVDDPAVPLECTNRLRTRDCREPGHQRETSTSRVDTVSGIP